MANKNILNNVAYDYLFNQICSGALPPNCPLVEQDISALLSISRTPVREALQSLERNGLVQHLPYRGTIVKETTLQDIYEIFQLRELFEFAAMEASIQAISEEEISRLEESLSIVNNSSPLDQFYETDRLLHGLIFHYNYNARMLSFYNILSAQIERIRRLSSAQPKRMMQSRAEHLEIVDAIKKRDLDLAKEKLRIHLDNVKKSVINVMQATRPELHI